MRFVGQKDDEDGVLWWEQPLSAAPVLGFGRRRGSEQGPQQGSRPEVSVEGRVAPLSQHC